jgi:hypothetical protein
LSAIKNKVLPSENFFEPPEPHSKLAIASLEKYFKGAMKGSEAEEKVYQQLKELGFTSKNTLFADSSCPDEINKKGEEEDISS